MLYLCPRNPTTHPNIYPNTYLLVRKHTTIRKPEQEKMEEIKVIYGAVRHLARLYGTSVTVTRTALKGQFSPLSPRIKLYKKIRRAAKQKGLQTDKPYKTSKPCTPTPSPTSP